MGMNSLKASLTTCGETSLKDDSIMKNNIISDIMLKAYLEARQRPVKDKTLKDCVMTPFPLAKALIGMITPEPGLTFLDPCRGTGAFYNQFPDCVEKDWCEILQGRDFFEQHKQFDWVIGNPPYSVLSRWWEHTLDISKIGFAYLLGVHNLTTKRIQDAQNKGFSCIHMHLLKVKDWFGYSLFIIFKKDCVPAITSNRITWVHEDAETDQTCVDELSGLTENLKLDMG